MTGSDTTSKIYQALAEPRRRKILAYFVAENTETASFDELLEVLVESDGRPVTRETAEIQLRHADLPALEKCDLIEQDPRSETVRYQGHDLVELNLDRQLDRVRSQ